jgi:2-dehydro-3-deoxyphosphogluconate aldolase/(4S)-4-hydroxy-2-oxoglutarate aldolase
MKRTDVIQTIERVGVVPMVRAPSAELGGRAVEAVLAGGVSIFEITMTVPDAVRLIGTLCDRYAGRAVVGAGTVLRADQARACIDAGAAFIASPAFDRETVELARSRDVAVMAGGLTPTEVISAWRAGADMVKIFPCSAVGGPKYLAALKAPLPEVKLLPAGGVSLANLHDYIAHGASAVGVGSELIDVAALEANQDDTLTERAASFVRAVAAARSKN